MVSLVCEDSINRFEHTKLYLRTQSIFEIMLENGTVLQHPVQSVAVAKKLKILASLSVVVVVGLKRLVVADALSTN